MALHPLNDRLKIEVQKDAYGFNDDKPGTESGIVVEVPDMLIYLSFHSFAFEDSFGNKVELEKIQQYYNKLMGKKVFWEALQDRGRTIHENDKDYVYLQMTDVLAVADNVDDDAQTVNQTGSAGSFNL